MALPFDRKGKGEAEDLWAITDDEKKKKLP